MAIFNEELSLKCPFFLFFIFFYFFEVCFFHLGDKRHLEKKTGLKIALYCVFQYKFSWFWRHRALVYIIPSFTLGSQK